MVRQPWSSAAVMRAASSAEWLPLPRNAGTVAHQSSQAVSPAMYTAPAPAGYAVGEAHEGLPARARTAAATASPGRPGRVRARCADDAGERRGVLGADAAHVEMVRPRHRRLGAAAHELHPARRADEAASGNPGRRPARRGVGMPMHDVGADAGPLDRRRPPR